MRASLPAAVLFDMDGTLTDTEALWFRAETEILAGLGRQWRPGDEMAVVGLNLLDACRYLVSHLELSVSAEFLADALTDRVVELGEEHGMPWRPGAFELLERVTALGIPSALVTASRMSFARLTLDQAPQGSLEVAITGDQVTNGKPDPEPYTKAIERLGVSPGSTLAFEDSVYGLSSARAAGAVTVGVPLKMDLSGREDVIIIGSLAEADEDFLRAVMA